MKCSGHCWKGNQPCPHPYDCSVQERRSDPVALEVRNGGESVDTELPAPTMPIEKSTYFIDDFMRNVRLLSVVIGGMAVIFIIAALAAYLVRHT